MPSNTLAATKVPAIARSIGSRVMATLLASSGRHLRIFLSEISCGEEIDEMLHRGVGVMIRLLDLRGLRSSIFGMVLKERVRERAADALMKQNEQRTDPNPFVCESIGIRATEALQ